MTTLQELLEVRYDGETVSAEEMLEYLRATKSACSIPTVRRGSPRC